MTNPDKKARQPKGVPTGGEFAPQDRAEATTELTETVEVRFADGSTLSAPVAISGRIIGKDAEGRVIAQEVILDEVLLFALTSCCLATDKGVEDGIVCRNCYRYLEVEEMPLTVEVRDVIYPTLDSGGTLPMYTPEQATRVAREHLAENAYPLLRYSDLVGVSDLEAQEKVRAAAAAIWDGEWDRRLNLLYADPRVEAGYEALRALSASGAATRQQAIELSAHIAEIIHKETRP